MGNKPTSDQQPDRQQNRNDSQPIPPRPPKREQKAHPQNNTSDFTRDDIKARENQQRADNRRPQVSSR